MQFLTSVKGQISAKVLALVALLFLTASTVLLIFFPASGASELIEEVFSMGWPGVLGLAVLLGSSTCRELQRKYPPRIEE